MADETPPDAAEDEISLGARNRRKCVYHQLLATLPQHVRATADQKFALFVVNPRHVSLRLHKLKDRSRGQHVPGSYSVSVTPRYRAIFFIDGQTNVWYWIGTHADYDCFTGLRCPRSFSRVCPAPRLPSR